MYFTIGLACLITLLGVSARPQSTTPTIQSIPWINPCVVCSAACVAIFTGCLFAEVMGPEMVAACIYETGEIDAGYCGDCWMACRAGNGAGPGAIAVATDVCTSHPDAPQDKCEAAATMVRQGLPASKGLGENDYSPDVIAKVEQDYLASQGQSGGSTGVQGAPPAAQSSGLSGPINSTVVDVAGNTGPLAGGMGTS